MRLLIAASCCRIWSRLLLQFGLSSEMVFNGGLTSGDLLARGRGGRFDFPQRLDAGLQAAHRVSCCSAVGLLDERAALVDAAAQIGQLGFARGDLPRQLLPVHQSDLRSQVLQALGAFAVAAGLAGLRADAAQAAFDLVDNVGQAQQILLHALQPPHGRWLSWL